MNRYLAIIPLILTAGCSEQYARENDPAPTIATERGDVEHAAAIREELAAAPDLSTAAKNVTVTALDGKVTLRGTVPSEIERSRVEEIAEGVPATRSVENQIETEQPR